MDDVAPDARRRPLRQIDRGHRDVLASFRERAVVKIDDLGPTLFCHGFPRGDEEVLTGLTPERRWWPGLEELLRASFLDPVDPATIAEHLEVGASG